MGFKRKLLPWLLCLLSIVTCPYFLELFVDQFLLSPLLSYCRNPDEFSIPRLFSCTSSPNNTLLIYSPLEEPSIASNYKQIKAQMYWFDTRGSLSRSQLHVCSLCIDHDYDLTYHLFRYEPFLVRD